MKRITYLLAVMLVVICSGCSKQKYFKVKGKIDGLGAMTVTMLYYSGGGLQRVSAHGDGMGEFELRGESAGPTLAVVELSDGTVLANLVARNGENISLKGELGSPMTIEVKGSKPSSDMARWQKDNAALLAGGAALGINQAVKRFVENNKGNLASTAILVTHFRSAGYELLADSLMTVIDVDARPGSVVQNFSSVLAGQLSSKTLAAVKPMTLYEKGDTSFYFVPSAQKLSLLAFVPGTRDCRDSIVTRLKNMRERYAARKLEIVELNMSTDSAQWRKSVRSDSAIWHQTWAPAAVAAPSIRSLCVPRLPYFIVADSAGNQVLRTHSISEAGALIDHTFK